MGAVAVTIAIALGTAFMQPMHAASYPLEEALAHEAAAAAPAGSPGAARMLPETAQAGSSLAVAR